MPDFTLFDLDCKQRLLGLLHCRVPAMQWHCCAAAVHSVTDGRARLHRTCLKCCPAATWLLWSSLWEFCKQHICLFPGTEPLFIA